MYSNQGCIFVSNDVMIMARVTTARGGVQLQTPQTMMVTMIRIGFIARLAISVLLSLIVIAALVTLYGGGG